MTTNNKKQPVPQSTITRSLPELWEQTGNIYETVRIISKRANQISVEMRDEIREKIQEVTNYQDALDETPTENSEQIEVSKYYEQLPKPTLVATTEFLNGEVYFRLPNEESQD
ncbi:DNA-directed RNA polymerase subunit omega [uncultured Porphyromonas sp.]|uniref:DNA-directed RNA polymerase subunit omega n=1 Tax=uncultured Porphyromonas sp. TaxID=159274 RepID=UPI00262133C1|nr:DNA-directed RNA polymerase subunit omega [uncultured Porphyromonas sp.]